ncbi:hypothetical protein BgiMline_030859 [Biomphalaria glabrata]
MLKSAMLETKKVFNDTDTCKPGIIRILELLGLQESSNIVDHWNPGAAGIIRIIEHRGSLESLSSWDYHNY